MTKGSLRDWFRSILREPSSKTASGSILATRSNSTGRAEGGGRERKFVLPSGETVWLPMIVDGETYELVLPLRASCRQPPRIDLRVYTWPQATPSASPPTAKTSPGTTS